MSAFLASPPRHLATAATSPQGRSCSCTKTGQKRLSSSYCSKPSLSRPSNRTISSAKPSVQVQSVYPGLSALLRPQVSTSSRPLTTADLSILTIYIASTRKRTLDPTSVMDRISKAEASLCQRIFVVTRKLYTTQPTNAPIHPVRRISTALIIARDISRNNIVASNSSDTDPNVPSIVSTSFVALATMDLIGLLDQYNHWNKLCSLAHEHYISLFHCCLLRPKTINFTLIHFQDSKTLLKRISMKRMTRTPILGTRKPFGVLSRHSSVPLGNILYKNVLPRRLCGAYVWNREVPSTGPSCQDWQAV